MTILTEINISEIKIGFSEKNFSICFKEYFDAKITSFSTTSYTHRCGQQARKYFAN